MRKIQHFFLAFLQVASGAGLKLCVSMLVKIKDFGLARGPNPKNFLASQGREVTGCKFSLFRNEAVSGAPIDRARFPLKVQKWPPPLFRSSRSMAAFGLLVLHEVIWDLKIRD